MEMDRDIFQFHVVQHSDDDFPDLNSERIIQDIGRRRKNGGVSAPKVETGIHNLEKMLRRLIGEDIEMNLALSNDIGPVFVDPCQLEQVIFEVHYKFIE